MSSALSIMGVMYFFFTVIGSCWNGNGVGTVVVMGTA